MALLRKYYLFICSIEVNFGGGRVGIDYLKHWFMIIMYVLLFLLVLSIVCGYIGSVEMTIGIEINTLMSPFFKIGLYSQRYTLEDGSVEDEIVIGLFFINVVMVFWKTVDEEI
jgi:hypothetical protein